MIHRQTVAVLGAPIDVVSWDDALARIAVWASGAESRSVCLCNVHSVVSARGDPALAHAIRSADLTAPDGAPIAWMLRRLGHREQERIAGPDLMWRALAQAEDNGHGVFLLGGTRPTLIRLRKRILKRFPRLSLVGAIAPPFRPLSAEDNARIVQHIQRSGAQLVFVALGCPKQERWIAEQKGRVPAVMVGVGAAFEFHAGTRSRAPRWMRATGLEWLHRLISEPRRLAWRYLSTNTVFVVRALGQLLARPFARWR